MKSLVLVLLVVLFTGVISRKPVWKCPPWPYFFADPCPNGILPGSTCNSDNDCPGASYLCCWDWVTAEKVYERCPYLNTTFSIKMRNPTTVRYFDLMIVLPRFESVKCFAMAQ
ncbi:uncharacterized protein LOC143234929 [Tachypleus tridentatus]|uniref:uncharacterized protein LOC143234929 n=1 Tax=Tachypleus tridentatus TaxID=6853 RepID=UPI003FCF0424